MSNIKIEDNFISSEDAKGKFDLSSIAVSRVLAMYENEGKDATVYLYAIEEGSGLIYSGIKVKSDDLLFKNS